MNARVPLSLVPAPIPQDLKALPPALESQLLQLLADTRSEGYQAGIDRGARNSRELEYRNQGFDSPDVRSVLDRVEELECAELDRDELVETGRAVLRVLSLLRPELERLEPHAREAVDRFEKAMEMVPQ